MRELTVAVLQLALARAEEAENIAAVSALVEEAAGKGAQVILPPELFADEYFCREEEEELFALARPTAESPSVRAAWSTSPRSPPPPSRPSFRTIRDVATAAAC